MAMNRRNVLIGLGAVAAGGGAAIGTGAFSTVEAQRTVSLSPADDNSANVRLSVDDSNAISDSGSNTINIDGENLNYNAITTVNGALTITVSPNATGNHSIDLLDSIGGNSVSKDSADRTSGDVDMQFVSNDGESDAGVTDEGDGSFSTVSPGNSVVYDVTFNLLGDTGSGEVTVPFSNGTVVVKVE